MQAILPFQLRKEFWHNIPREWKMVYRYLGLPALIRCLSGTRSLVRTIPFDNPEPGMLDCVTCSLVPEIAKLWGTFSLRSLSAHQPRIVIADSSGYLTNAQIPGVEILPLFNFNHGIKLDLLMSHACRSEYVLVCDDDIFWLDDTPLRYALDRFSENSKLAVVSLQPRPNNNIQLMRYVEQAMGSYCLIIRRSIWLKEQLSFVYHKSERWKEMGNYFDTADYANMQLVQRGYEVEIAPEEVRESLVTFYSSTIWGIRILACEGEIGEVVNLNRLDEHKKVYRTAIALKGFQDLLAKISFTGKQLIDRKFLDRAETLAKQELSQSTIEEVEKDTSVRLNRMREILARFESKV